MIGIGTNDIGTEYRVLTTVENFRMEKSGYNEDEWIKKLHKKYYHLFSIYEKDHPHSSLVFFNEIRKENGKPIEEGSSVYKEGDILRGIESPNGWRKLTENFLERIDELQKNNLYIKNPSFDGSQPETEENPRLVPDIENQIKIFQIKEKFGSLRIYFDECPESIKYLAEHAVGYAEGQADLTCCVCGKVGDWGLTGGGRCVKLCDECVN